MQGRNYVLSDHSRIPFTRFSISHCPPLYPPLHDSLIKRPLLLWNETTNRIPSPFEEWIYLLEAHPMKYQLLRDRYIFPFTRKLEE